MHLRPRCIQRLASQWLALVCAVLQLGLAAAAGADDAATVLRLRGEALAAAGRCEEALSVFATAHARSPEDALLRLRSGQCQIRLERYAAAVETLEAARAASPGLEDVDLYLAVARYHVGDIEGAERALAAARGHTRDSAQLELYTGLVHLQSARAREAALALERARSADPDAVEPAASYYAGRAWQRAADAERGRLALARVVEGSPGSVWAREASRSLDTSRRSEPRAWLSGSAGMEYDSNVLLGGSRIDVSDRDDFRGVWSVETGVELFRTRRWAGGVHAAYSGNAQLDLSRFNTHYPTTSAWVDHELGRNTEARLRVDFGYANVDDADFLLNQRSELSLFRSWGRRGRTDLSALFFWNDYRFPLRSVPDANRDGIGTGFRIEHHLPLGGVQAELHGAYAFQTSWSEGTEYDYDAHEVSLGVSTTPFLAVRVEASGSYTFQPFDHATVFPRPASAEADRDREDEILAVSLIARRALNEVISVALEYSYTNSDSNVRVFDYERHIVGVRALFALR